MNFGASVVMEISMLLLAYVKSLITMQLIDYINAHIVEGRESIREAVPTGNGTGFVSKAEFGFDSRLQMLGRRNCE